MNEELLILLVKDFKQLFSKSLAENLAFEGIPNSKIKD